MFRLVLLLAVGLSLAFAPAPFPRPAKRDPNKEDLKKIQGTWQEPGGFVWVIRGSRLKFVVGGKTISEWQITLDAGKKPKQFDLHWRAGSGQGVSPLGIYRLQGDVLTVCFDDETRPTDFRSLPGAQEQPHLLRRGLLLDLGCGRLTVPPGRPRDTPSRDHVCRGCSSPGRGIPGAPRQRG
jgi:uncharacterized protein (TIGR03067 family)